MTESSEIKIIDLKGCSYCNEIKPVKKDEFEIPFDLDDHILTPQDNKQEIENPSPISEEEKKQRRELFLRGLAMFGKTEEQYWREYNQREEKSKALRKIINEWQRDKKKIIIKRFKDEKWGNYYFRYWCPWCNEEITSKYKQFCYHCHKPITYKKKRVRVNI